MIVPDGITDNYHEIQAQLDSLVGAPLTAPRYVELPIGDIYISHPLHIKTPKTTLTGSIKGETRLFGGFAGHIVLGMLPRPFYPVLGASLANGAGNSLKLHPGGVTKQKQVHVVTEPNLNITGLTELTISYFFRRNTPTSVAGVHFYCGGKYGAAAYQAYGVWDWFQGLGIAWNNVTYHCPGVAQDEDVTYYIQLAFQNGVLKVYVGEPNGPAELVKTIQTGSPTVPYRGSVDVLSFGYDTIGPIGSQYSWGGPDGWLDGWSMTKDYTPVMVCPDVKPTANANTLLIMNFEVEEPYFIGRSKNNRLSYILPHMSEVLSGTVKIQNLTFMGSHGASGPRLHDCIFSHFNNLEIVGSYVGYVISGTTFGLMVNDIRGQSYTFAWIQGNQSMQTVASSIKIGSFNTGSITFYVHGAVGGAYTGLYLTPYSELFASLYVGATYDFNIYNGQIDDEGQAGVVSNVLIIDGAWVKIRDMLIARATPGNLIACHNGGSAILDGSWIASLQGNEPQIKFYHPPSNEFKFTLMGVVRHPATIPLSTHPEYINDLGMDEMEA